MNVKILLKRFIPLLPVRIQSFLRAQNKQRQRRNRSGRERAIVHIADILYLLSKCELTEDFMIHGSISNIGKLDQPVSELMKAWIQQIDLTRQTVLCPALSYNTTMLEYLESCANFDVRTSKNAMGAISNWVMKFPGCLRSLHPTHSVVALGAKAEEYISSHEFDTTPFGLNSPYQKLVLKEGKIVMFGVGLNSVTCFHVYEDILGPAMPISVYLDRSFQISCIGLTGVPIVVTTRCHDPNVSAIRECERMRDVLVKTGAMKSYALGDSELSVINARLFTITLLEMLAKGKSIYGDIKISPEQTKRISECRELLM